MEHDIEKDLDFINRSKNPDFNEVKRLAKYYLGQSTLLTSKVKSLESKVESQEAALKKLVKPSKRTRKDKLSSSSKRKEKILQRREKTARNMESL